MARPGFAAHRELARILTQGEITIQA